MRYRRDLVSVQLLQLAAVVAVGDAVSYLTGIRGLELVTTPIVVFAVLGVVVTFRTRRERGRYGPDQH